jgi:lysophospholipase L1-like esterase
MPARELRAAMSAGVLAAAGLLGLGVPAFGADLGGSPSVASTATAAQYRAVTISQRRGAPKRVVGPRSPVFRYAGGAPGDAGYGRTYFKPVNVNYLNASPPWSVTFRTTGRTFAVSTVATGARYRFVIDGRPTAVRRLAGTWEEATIRVRFKRPASRRIRLELGNRGWFGGVQGQVRSNDENLGPRTIWVGDSYTDGDSVEDSLDGYAQVASRLLGLGDAWASGLAGTGYVNSGGEGKVPFGARLDGDVLAYRPRTVIMAGGINDYEAEPDELRRAALDVFRRVAASGARLVVIGPWQLGDQSDEEIDNRDAIASAAAEAGGLFVDTTGWITEANRGQYIGEDGVHPTAAGHAYLGRRVAAAIQAL